MKGLVLLPAPSIVVDFYAGSGKISGALWSKLDTKLTCIEKEQAKLDTIQFPCVKICDDNRNHINLAANADIVDLDAYGLVMKPLKDILAQSKKTQLLFFTESNPFSKYMSTTINELLKLDITAFWIEKSNASNVYYGYVYRKI